MGWRSSLGNIVVGRRVPLHRKVNDRQPTGMGRAVLIGQVAEQTGVTTKALRFYERKGLVPEPERTAGGYRSYDSSIVDRVAFIKDAQAAGFTLAQVGEILAIRDAGEVPCGHVVTLVRERLALVEQRLRELQAIRVELRRIEARADAFEPDDCDGYCGLIASG